MGLVEGNQDALGGGASVQAQDTPNSGVTENSTGCLVEKFNAALVHQFQAQNQQFRITKRG